MGRPILNQDHICGENACGIGSACNLSACHLQQWGGSDRLRTSRIGMTPEHNGAILIVWMSQYFVELDGEAIQMADVQWTKVGVESIV